MRDTGFYNLDVVLRNISYTIIVNPFKNSVLIHFKNKLVVRSNSQNVIKALITTSRQSVNTHPSHPSFRSLAFNIPTSNHSHIIVSFVLKDLPNIELN